MAVQADNAGRLYAVLEKIREIECRYPQFEPVHPILAQALAFAFHQSWSDMPPAEARDIYQRAVDAADAKRWRNSQEYRDEQAQLAELAVKLGKASSP